MSSPIIEIQNISKRYAIGKKEAYGSLRDEIMQTITAPFRRRAQGAITDADDTTIWALRDVSFEVQEGEVIGVIGRNGAGKSTLLKILSRITEPTSGRIVLKGRVASLLEVGTGFHPELTGRENIFLNGALLGMSRQEIKAKFDEIVAFSEIEKFLDTPVKRYSSGMYVRLAFAVAAHLEPEILIVDEVLAVGDAAFQKKCLGKMGDVAKAGRTVLFVSHNMSAVNRLCSRAILLDSGRLIQDGSAMEVSNAYLNNAGRGAGERTWDFSNAPGTEKLRLMDVKLLKEDDETPVSVVDVGEPLKLQIGYYVGKPNLLFRCVAMFFTQGICAFASMELTENVRADVGRYSSTVTIPPHLLAEGEYTVSISIFTSRGVKHHYLQMKDVIAFQVFDPMTGTSARGDYAQNFAGVVRPLLQWQLLFEGNNREIL